MARHRGFDIGGRNAPHQILWIHGYTGSPDAFVHTAEKLSNALNARVLAPLLPGHGTDEWHLPRHTFEEFLSSARYFARTLPQNKKIAYIGYSFGGYIAALLAGEFHPKALVMCLTPYRLRFPLWLPGLAELMSLRSFWNKNFSAEDVEIRKGTFYYPDLPGNTLSLIHEGNSQLETTVSRLDMPILTIHNNGDPIADPESGPLIVRSNGGNQSNESHILADGRHALFFRPGGEVEEKLVIDFLRKQFEKEHKVS